MLIILISLLNISTSFAQTKAPIVLQKDQAGRPFYYDKDGDKIVILDYQTRKDVEDVIKFKHMDGKNLPVDPKSFYKDAVSVKIVETPKVVYRTYRIEEGDTWQSISLKLFGTEKRWPQLKLWNENLQTKIILPPGAEMRYIEDKN
jgi:hypothetical protein